MIRDDARGAAAIATALGSASIMVVVGPGGVGKTSVAAGLGVAAAVQGRRVVVLTIDPARRLAQALGAELGHEPVPVVLEGQPRDGAGTMHACMLDTRTTFDGLVTRFARNEADAESLRQNRIYQTLSSQVAGTGAYMAVQRLHELQSDERFDLVVVDTPPARSAQDILDAPDRIQGLLTGRALKLLMGPAARASRSSLRVIARTSSAFTGLVAKVTGIQLVEDLQAFLVGIDDIAKGLGARSAQVRELYRSEGTAFVAVSTATTEALDQTRALLSRLGGESLRVCAVVGNQLAAGDPSEALDLEALAAALADAENTTAESTGPRAADLETVTLHAARASRQRARQNAMLRTASDGVPVVGVALRAGGLTGMDALVSFAYDLVPKRSG